MGYIYKRRHVLSSYILLWGIMVCPVSALAAPVIFYTDIITGPKTGGENNNGTYLTIVGKRFGPTQGTSTVTIGGGEVAVYKVWSDTKVSVQLGPNVATGNVLLTTPSGSTTAPEPFTVSAGNIWFVSTTGSDTTGAKNDITHPFRSLNAISSITVKTVQGFVPGDHIIIRGGTYDLNDSANNLANGNTWLRWPISGTATQYTAWLGYPGETATVILPAGKHLVVNGGPTCGWYQVFANWKVIQTGCGTGGPWGIGSIASTGICTTPTDSSLGEAGYNRIINIDMDGQGTGGACYLGADSSMELGFSQHVKLFGFNVHDTGTYAGRLGHIIYLSSTQHDNEYGWSKLYNIPSSRAIIQVHQDQFAGSICWSFKSMTDIKIHDNIIYNVAGQPSLFDGGTGDIWYYNNIIYNPLNSSYEDMVSARGSGGLLNLRMFNNTIYENVAGAGTNWILNIGMSGHFPQHLTLNNNIFYVAKLQDQYYGTYNTTQSLTNWINAGNLTSANNLWYGSSSAMPYFATINELNVNPNFVSPSTGNFHLLQGSLAILSGTNTVSSIVSTDFDGNPRLIGVGFDIGAYQYQADADYIAPKAPTNLKVK